MATYHPAALSDAGDVLGDGTVVLEPNSWVGKTFPLLDYIDIADRLKEGEWTVVLYREGCPRCNRAIAEILSAHGNSPVERTALIELSRYSGRPVNVDNRAQRLVTARLTSAREWFVQVPVVCFLRRAIVVSIDQSRANETPAERQWTL
jgi:hypothetical protein